MLKVQDAKKRLTDCCDELATIVREGAVEYGESALKAIVELRQNICDHVYRVYLLGPFSCGKSTLLNRYLGEDILSTGLAPETAVSTELRYGEHKHMLLEPLNPRDSVIELDGINDENMSKVRDLANSHKLANVVMYMDNPRLKAHKDICLVDMPGLDSGNPAHEAALIRFIQSQERLAVFCLPMTDGTIHGTAFDFLKKIMTYGMEQPTVVLTKADERLQSDHPAIMDVVRGQLTKYGWNDAFVGRVSRDSIEDFARLIERFDAQRDDFILGWFGKKLRNVAEDVLSPLRRALAKKFDDSHITEALEKIEATERDLPALVCDIKSEMKMSTRSAINDVMEKVHQTVMDQQGALLSKAESGMDCAAEVATLIRSTLADVIPPALADAVSVAEKKAGELLSSRVGGNDGMSDDAVSSEVLEPVSYGVTSYSGAVESYRRSGSSQSSLTPFQMGATIGESAFILGELFLPGPGGLIGVALATLAIPFLCKDDREAERSRRQAEFTMWLEKACSNIRDGIENKMMGEAERCGNKLESAVEGRIRELHSQMDQLRRESAAGKAEWEAQRARRQEHLERVEAALRNARIGDV